ncbi:MAG: 6,7-dimethyl-8-ribityllumazine synthase [Planctomycetota bacterium]
MHDHLPIAVIVSRYNAAVTDELARGATTELARLGHVAAVIDAPGAFELPVIAAHCVDSGAYAAVVCLGCLVRGETRHDRYIAGSVANAIARLSVESGVPVAFGVITAETAEQARDRAGGAKGNKGEEAARAAVAALRSIRAIEEAVAAGDPAAVAPTTTEALPDKSAASTQA